MANLPGHVIDLIDAGLIRPATGPRRRSGHHHPLAAHGHVAAVAAMAARLGLPALLSPAGRHRDLALALIISRVVQPG